jgi:hypothetical protein
LQVELVVDPEISTLDIQAWIQETKAPLVLMHGMDNHFDELVEALGYGRGVSRPSRWLTALAISRFDSTQL